MRGSKRIQWCSVVLLVFCFASCQVKRPQDVLSDTKMENVLYDYHIAKAMGEDVAYNENYKRQLYMESVFNKYGITQADFDSSMVWYARNPEVLTKIYEKVNLRLKAERDGINHLIAMRDNKPKESLPGDSIDVWAWQNIYQLTGMTLDNKIAFTLPSDSNFHNRDTLCWSVRFRFHNGMPDSLYAPLMAMQIQYDNDSVISSSLKVQKAGFETIRLSADSIGKIKEVRGFIYYPMQKSPKPILADRISLMRYHATDTLAITSKDSLQQKADSLKIDSIKKETEQNQPATTPMTGDSVRRPSHRPRPSLREIEKK